jgi:hypothetical protein
VLTILNSRDQIERALHDHAAIAVDTLEKLAKLDTQLKNLADAIVDASVSESPSQFADWRMSFHPEPQRWWWYLDQRRTINPHPWNALDGLSQVSKEDSRYSRRLNGEMNFDQQRKLSEANPTELT